MMNIDQRIGQLNWDDITEGMHQNGFACVPDILPGIECDRLIANYNNPALYRKTIMMERYRFGMGEYKYFQYPLPDVIQQLRETMYPKLAAIANSWMRVLNIEKQFPDSLAGLIELCKANNQYKPTPLLLNYGIGGYNTLHQDLYGDIYFPMQLVLFLNAPEVDYQGGEFVLVEQRPRAQSKAVVLKPSKGDMLIFTTNFRPVKGSKGYYRVNMKHGVSEVKAGNRHTAGVIFHDAL
ncbi:2OG-Fe(II) oxygenase [Mucilaginibacter sp.]|uniref:2OG-Fe(II) oxygenase n=1 Tax=Mucilaginibacter sp. TaxID=1882438 RepID=UPI003D0E89D5